jgi:hypothetical protein
LLHRFIHQFSRLRKSRTGKRLNLPFRFMWPPPLLDSEFNAVSSLESIFSQLFIDDHLDDSLPLGEFIPMDREPVTRDMIEAVRRGDKKGLRIAHLRGPVRTEIGISISGSEIAKTFAELPFAERIRSALRAAERLERNSAIAVHARRGDIVYGEYR